MQLGRNSLVLSTNIHSHAATVNALTPYAATTRFIGSDHAEHLPSHGICFYTRQNNRNASAAYCMNI